MKERGMMRKAVDLVSPDTWFISPIVFLPLIFSGLFFDGFLFFKVVAGFISFSFVKSASLLIRDLKVKRGASHKIEFMLFALLITSFVGAFFISTAFGLLAIGYLALLVGLFFFKWIFCLDILSSGAEGCLVLAGGALICAVELSPYLVLSVFLGATFLHLASLRYGPPVEKGYPQSFIDQAFSFTGISFFVFYSLFAVLEKETIIFTIPVVLWGILRIFHLAHEERKKNFQKVILGDGVLLSAAALWLAATLLLAKPPV